MFINANPRGLAKETALETIVLHPKSEPMRRSLAEMTNSDVNACNAYRQAHSPVSVIDWDTMVDFGGNENTPQQLHNSYGGNFQDTSSLSLSTSARTSYYATGNSAHYQQPKTSLQSHSAYQESTRAMDSLAKQSPISANDHWNHNIDIFTDVSAGSNAKQDFSYQITKSGSEVEPFVNTFPGSISSGSYPESSSTIGDYANSTSPNSVYSTYSHSGPSTDFPFSTGFSMFEDPENSTRQTWFPDNIVSTSVSNQDVYNLPSTSHGPPGNFSSPQYYRESWNLGSSQVGTWDPQPPSSGTISARALNLNSTPASLPMETDYSTERLPEKSYLFKTIQNNVVNNSLLVRSEKPGSSSRQARRKLPDAVPVYVDSVPASPSKHFTSSTSSKRCNLKSKSEICTRTRASPVLSTVDLTTKGYYSSIEPTPQKYTAPQRIEPKASRDADQNWQASSPSNTNAKSLHFRDPKDDYLVKAKLSGMSYKDIRRQGGFTEAESTLRGRFRTLTKHKSARVRKPEWNEGDIRLLKKAVRKLSQNSGRISWKKVAEYIANNGGSYHFGNATCRKKWDELQEQAP